MKLAYRIIAYLIAVGVALQAAAVALAFFGLFSWIVGGGSLDKSAMESETTQFTGVGGLIFHGTVGIIVIPVLGLLLLICSFFTKVRGAIMWAGIVLGSIVIQVVLGMFAHSFYLLGAVHGLFAFAVFAFAAVAAHRMPRTTAATPAAPAEEAPRAGTTADVG